MNYINFSRSQNTIFEMMVDRGFATSDVSEISKEKFTEFIEGGDDFYLDFVSEFDDKTVLRVLYHVSEGVDADDLKKLFKMLNNDGITNCIFIKHGKCTPVANATFASCPEEFDIQVFDISETINNITKHEYVPPHILLPEEVAKDLLEKYGVSKGQIPRLSIREPIVKYHGWKKGDVVKIVRKTEILLLDV